jgi:hypothetical protein
MALRINDGDSEHSLIRPAQGKGNASAKRVQLRISRKL